MNASSSVEEDRSVVYLCSRDSERNRRWHKITDIFPHFWAPDQTGTERDFFDRPVRLVTTQISRSVSRLRDTYSFTDEADIRFALRVLIDKEIRCGYAVENSKIIPAGTLNIPPRKGFFDLEVETPPEILARPANPKFRIVSFQFADSYTKQITLFMLHTNITGQSVEKPEYLSAKAALTRPVVFTLRKQTITVNPIIYLYDDERLMIRDAARWFGLQEFDTAGGWNSNIFDWAYWIRRAKLLSVDITSLSPFKSVYCELRKDKQTGAEKMEPYVKGVALIDLMEMYKKWSGGRQPVVKGRPFGLTYDFHAVMEYECGFYYVDLGDRVAESRQNHPEEWVEYCCGDAFALALLDEEKGIIRYFDNFRRVVGLPLEKAIYNSQLIDMRLLRLRDRPLPTKSPKKSLRVKGALVLLPEIGIHENIAFVDEKSLYPSLIRLYNLGSETLVRGEARKDDVVIGPMEDGRTLRFRRIPESLFAKSARLDMEEREKYRRLLKTMDIKNPRYEETKMLETLHKFLACFRKGTLIATPTGEIPIENIEKGDEIYGFENGKVVKTKVLQTMSRPTMKICEIITTTPRRVINVTAEHPLWSTQRVRVWKWTEASKLLPRTSFTRSYLYSPIEMPVEETESTMEDDAIKLLAFWIAEGTQECYGCGTPTIFIEPQYVEELKRAAKHFNCKLKETDLSGNYRISSFDHTCNQFHELIRKYGLDGTNSYSKFLPKKVFKLPRRQRLLFLQWLRNGDGSHSTWYSNWNYYTKSRRLARDVSFLAWTVGIQSSIYPGIVHTLRRDTEVGIKSITSKRTDEMVYNLETDVGSYIAERFVVHNCSYYGVTGYENFRLVDDDVRAAITFLGREGLVESKKDLEKAGYRVIYGDTDGLFIKLKTNVIQEGNIVEQLVNQTLQRIALTRGARFPIEAKYEHFCKRIVFVPKITRRKGQIIAAKKSYAYTDEKDNLFVVGLAPRRSSTATVSRELMLTWLELVLIAGDVKGAITLIRNAWKELPSYPINKIGLPGGLHKTYYATRNPWLDGCQYMTKNYHKVFREDKKPLLVWMGHNLDTDVICITETDSELPERLKRAVDWERMKKLVIENRFRPLFEAINVGWDEVLLGQRQQDLAGWIK